MQHHLPSNWYETFFNDTKLMKFHFHPAHSRGKKMFSMEIYLLWIFNGAKNEILCRKESSLDESKLMNVFPETPRWKIV